MKRTAKIALIACILVIAIIIAAGTVGCKSKYHAPIPTPRPSVVATSTPTIESTVIATPDQTPDETTVPTATPESTQTGTPTPTNTSQPDVTATPTATPTSTSQPTASATPVQTPAPTQTSAPTATQSGGSGGTSPTPTPTSVPTPIPTYTPAPTPTQTTTTVSISAPSQVNKGSDFTVTVNINNVAYMAYAFFDIKFNSSCISYKSCNSTSQIGGGSGTVSAGNQSGLVRVIVSYSNHANANGGYGISGSGYLCKLTFTATAQGISQLEFVEGQGSPQEGELTLIRWAAYSQSEIENVGWINSSITVY